MANNQEVVYNIRDIIDNAKDMLFNYQGGHMGGVYNNIQDIKTNLSNIQNYIKRDSVTESVGNNSNKKVKVADWYAEKYPDDADVMYGANDIALGDIIPYMLDYDKDFYEIVGVGDSVVRERIFEELANIYGVSYDDIYNLWLGDYNEIPKEVLKKFGI